MRHRHLIKGILLILLTTALVGACEQPSGTYYPTTPSYYYVVPTTTYLRSCASYSDQCSVVAQVYSGDRVTVLDRNDYNWARVRLERSGVVGWIPGDLLTPSPVPANYYVAWSSVYLRECADYNCRSVQLLHRGDRVDKIDQDYRGWWRVRALNTGITGWVPATAMSASPGPPYYYVAVSSLALRSGPSTSNRILTTLSLNSQVEMLGANAAGWDQVRETRTGLIGWVAGRYLESFPVSYPRSVHKRRTPKKSAPEQEQTPAPAKPKAM
jgi:uncharacterized protein YgiM (DUF1202 family)